MTDENTTPAPDVDVEDDDEYTIHTLSFDELMSDSSEEDRATIVAALTELFAQGRMQTQARDQPNIRIMAISTLIPLLDAGVDRIATTKAGMDPEMNTPAMQDAMRRDMIAGVQSAFTILGVTDEEFQQALVEVARMGVRSYNLESRIASFPLTVHSEVFAEPGKGDAPSMGGDSGFEHDSDNCPICLRNAARRG